MGLKKYFDSPEWDLDVPEGSELQKMVTKPKSVKKITNYIEEKVNLKVTKSKKKLTDVKKSIDQKSEKKLKRKKIKQGLLLQQNELKSKKNKFAMDEVEEDKIFVKERKNSQKKSKVSNKKKEISKNALKKIKRKSINADTSTEDKNQGIIANIHKKLQEKREEYHEQKKKREKKKKSQNKGKKNNDTENDLQNNKNQKNIVVQDIEICDMVNITNGNSEKEVNRNDNKPRPLTKTEKNRKRRRKKNKPANVNSEVSINLTSESSQQNPGYGKSQSDNSTLEGSDLKSQTLFGQGSMKKMQLKNKLLNVLKHDTKTNGETPNDPSDNENSAQKLKKETNAPKSLRQKMLEKLKGARFRYLNEQMYSKESRDANKLFSEDPSAFAAYHDGYRQQINKWPLNPLDVLIKDISRLPKGQTIADLGCGDARLSKSLPHKVFSFDLISLDPCVQACDMSHTPLLTGQVNVAVFCLSLMGTNLKDYIIEANRILKSGGVMKIAEVESRFENIEEFTKQIEKYGFKLLKKDLTQNLFYFMDFKKEGDIGNRKKLPHLTLKPCLYKKR